MIIRRSYRIERWAEWDHELHAFVQDFRRHFRVAPNLLLASEVTFARIDMAAAKRNIESDEGELAAEGEYTPLSAFVGEDYELEFAVATDLADRHVSLLHDTDPDGGGEEVPHQDTPLAVEDVLLNTKGG
jgi:hypothetical protein